MAKIVVDKSAAKAQGKQSGGIKSMLSRSTSRVSTARPSGAPKGAISTKPHGRIRNFFREVRVEMTKVTWPSRKEMLTATAVVIVAVVIAAVYIGVFDFVWGVIVKAVGLG